MIRLTILLFCFVSFGKSSVAQEVVTASLKEIIIAAQTSSPDFLIASTRLDNQYWTYVSAKSNFRPQLGLSGTIPQLNRSINTVQTATGPVFVNNAFVSNSVGLDLTQTFSQTGGTIFLNTSLERLDLFSTSSQDASTSYLSTPISLGFIQPIFQFNAAKWNRRIAEVEYAASKKRFAEENEQIAFEATNLFFDLYRAKLNLIEAQKNKTYLDSIAMNSEGRFSVGRISETDLLQVQLSAKNADSQLESRRLDLQNRIEALRNFLGINKIVNFELIKPAKVPEYEIDKQKALEYAWQNRSKTEEFRLLLLQSQRNADSAIKNNGPNLDLRGQVGLNANGPQFSDAYSQFNDRQNISLGINIPIADFGRRKASEQIAKSNLELTKLQLEQDSVNFEREILVAIEQFDLLKNQLSLSEESVLIAEKRLDIAKKRFNIGKIDVTNLNIAIQEEQAAQQQYLNALSAVYSAHYRIRNLTLFDFYENKTLVQELSDDRG